MSGDGGLRGLACGAWSSVSSSEAGHARWDAHVVIRARADAPGPSGLLPEVCPQRLARIVLRWRRHGPGQSREERCEAAADFLRHAPQFVQVNARQSSRVENVPSARVMMTFQPPGLPLHLWRAGGSPQLENG